MKNKRSIERQTRGWFPKDPILFTPNSARHRRKLEKWVANPFFTLGSLMIVSSLLSAVFGTVLVSAYLTILVEQVDMIFYSGLCVGILSLVAFALGLYSGVLLLSEKHVTRAVTGMATILCFGFATLLIPILEGLPSQSGLIVASPMIISSVASLLVASLSRVSQSTKRTNPKEQPTSRERIFAGLGAAGGGLTIMGLFFHFIHMYPSQADEVVLIIGVPLLVAAFLVRRTYKH
jgi:hypothetical protein